MLEKNGVPQVTMVTGAFEELAQVTARGRGMPSLPMVVIPPHHFQALPEPEARDWADKLFKDILAALTQRKD